MKKLIVIILTGIIIVNIQARQQLSRLWNSQLVQEARNAAQSMRPATRTIATESGNVSVQPTTYWWQQFKTTLENPIQDLRNSWQKYKDRIFEDRVKSEMSSQPDRYYFSQYAKSLDKPKYYYKKALQEGNPETIEKYGRRLKDDIERVEKSTNGWNNFLAKRSMLPHEREAYNRVAKGWTESLVRSKAEVAQQLEMNQNKLAQFNAREKIFSDNKYLRRVIEMIPQSIERNFFMLEMDLVFFRKKLVEQLEVLKNIPESDVVLKEDTQKVVDLLQNRISSLENAVILF